MGEKKNEERLMKLYSRAASGGEMERMEDGGEGEYNTDCDSGEVEDMKHSIGSLSVKKMRR